MLGLRILAVATLTLGTILSTSNAAPPRPAIPWTETELAPTPAPADEIDAGPRAFGPGVQAAADHLVALQCPDGLAGGGWGWPAVCPPMYHNLTGPIGLGLLHAHSLTPDASHLAAAVAGGDFDLAGTAARFPDNSGTWFGSFGPAFFSRLSTASGDSAYADNAAADFFDRLTAGTYGDPGVSASWPGDTYDWIARLQAARSGGLINLRPWDLHQLPWVAQSLGNADSTTPPDAVPQSTAFLNAMLDGLNTLKQNINPNTDFGDVIGIAGAVHGLALAGETSFTAINSPDHPDIDGMTTLCELADYLASLQNSDGSWYWHSDLSSPGEDSKSVQETAYAVLALSAAAGEGCGPYTTQIAAARDWLRTMQLPHGGFRAYPGGGEYAEITAEALNALQLESCTSNVLEFLLAAGSDCVQPGETVVVELHQRDLAQLVRGFQAFAQFDSSAMAHVSNVFTSVPYGLELLNTVSGDDIDLAAGIDNIFGGQTPTTDDALLVTLSFTAGATEGNTYLSFRLHDPPTWFSDDIGGQIDPCLVESPPICIDGTDPTIDCSGMDITAFNDAGLCSAVVDPGTPVADDDGCGLASVVGVRSDALNLNDPYPADCQCGLLAGAYNTSSLSENGWFSDDTRADGTGTETAGTNLVSDTLTDDPEATAAGTPAHDADILAQISFGTAPGIVPPGTHTGAVHLQIGASASGKSQISHRKDDGTGHAPGSVFGPGFAAEYHWMGDGTVSVTASLKFGIKTAEFGSTGASPRTGEDVWDKVLIYEPGNLNGGTSDGIWHTETISYTSGKWWFFDRTAGAGIIGTPMTLEAMSTSAVLVGAGPKTVADVYALITAPGAHITSVQFGIGSANAGGSVYVNQLETNFYRAGERTTFGCDPGTTTITWTATDCAGNTASCQQVITVVDNEGPDITCPIDAVISCDASTDPSNTGEASATDNCDASPEISYDDDVAPGDCAQESFITRTWTATDDCGNASTCAQLITIVDSTAPVITCAPDVVIENDPGLCSAALLFGGTPLYESYTPVDQPDLGLWTVDRYAPAAFDRVFFDDDWRLHIGIHEDDSAANRPPGFGSLFYNTQGRSRTLDNAPFGTTVSAELYIPADWATEVRRTDMWVRDSNPVEGSAHYPIIGFTSNDPADDVNPNPATPTPRYRYWDSNIGWVDLPTIVTYDTWHTLSITLTPGGFEYRIDGALVATDVVISDPGFEPWSRLFMQAYNFGETYDVYWDNVKINNAGSTTATDNCDPNPVITGVRSDALPLTDPYPVGITSITWSATDDCGNESQCKQTVTVLDAEPPVLTAGSIDDCYETAAEAEADAIAATAATDNCTDFGDLDFAAATVGDCAATITVTVTDVAGNSSEVQYQTQIDDTDPVITCPADISVNADAGLCSALLDFVEEFDADPLLSASQTPDRWYVDRYAPAAFESAFFDGDNRLRHAISSADSIGNRPGAFQSTFYNYQGRKYDVDMPLDTELSIDLYIPADWETDARHASLWATTFDSDNLISGFPILAFTANDPADELNPNPLGANVVPRFRVFTQDTDNDPGNGYTPGWVNLGLPGGFLYDQWVTFRIKLTATAYEFRVVTAQGDLTYTDNITFGSIRFGNIILQAYNFGSLPTYPVGDSYDVYWDNVTLGPEGPFVTDNCGVVSIAYERSDNALLTLFDPFPTGTTDVVWTATDCAGNSASCTQTVTVSGFNELVVTVELSPTMDPGPLTRCITFDLWDCPGGVPLATVTADLEFVGGLATATLENVPCGAYSCITARDSLHTLRRTDEAFGISGTQYVADFTGNPSSGGDWLIGGNLNDDNWIDILDFGVYSFLFGTIYGSGDTPCGTLAPQADIDGNGIVFTEDFTFIAINFLKGNEVNCCAALLGPEADEPGPVISITVEELVRRGLGHLAAGDLNRDAVLDVQDVVAFMQGARPVHRPRPRPLAQEELAPLQTPPGAAPAGGPASTQQNAQEIR